MTDDEYDPHHPNYLPMIGLAILAISCVVTVAGWVFFFIGLARIW